jgi:hypothetical protein
MALREKTHASWGTLGVRTGESEKIHRYPKRRKKKKKKGPDEVITLISKWDVRRYKENLEKNKKNRKLKARKRHLTNNHSKKNKKTLTIRTISRTHVPRERVNRRGKAAKNA